MDKTEIVKRTFKFYFSLVFKEAGLIWDSDNDSEIDSAIDNLIAVCKEDGNE